MHQIVSWPLMPPTCFVVICRSLPWLRVMSSWSCETCALRWEKKCPQTSTSPASTPSRCKSLTRYVYAGGLPPFAYHPSCDFAVSLCSALCNAHTLHAVHAHIQTITHSKHTSHTQNTESNLTFISSSLLLTPHHVAALIIQRVCGFLVYFTSVNEHKPVFSLYHVFHTYLPFRHRCKSGVAFWHL